MSKNERGRVLVFGSKWLGAEVCKRLSQHGHDVALICPDQADRAAQTARDLGLPWAAKPDDVPLCGADFPWRPTLCVSAHSYRMIPPWVIDWSRLGAIGYHPSLLPAFKGKGAIQAALDAGQRFTGGTMYWLTKSVDGGPVVVAGGRRLQERVQVLPNETSGDLWRRALAPLGVDLISAAAGALIGPLSGV